MRASVHPPRNLPCVLCRSRQRKESCLKITSAQPTMDVEAERGCGRPRLRQEQALMHVQNGTSVPLMCLSPQSGREGIVNAAFSPWSLMFYVRRRTARMPNRRSCSLCAPLCGPSVHGNDVGGVVSSYFSTALPSTICHCYCGAPQMSRHLPTTSILCPL